MDAKSHRDDSAGSSDTQSLVLDSIFYTKQKGFAQGENKESYVRVHRGTLGMEGRASRPSSRAAGAPGSPPAKFAVTAAYNIDHP